MTRKGETDAIWDAATAECYPSGVASSMRKEVNRLVEDLKDLHVSSVEIHRRAKLYREYCEKKDLMFGLRGLVRRWDQFPPPKRLSQRELDKLATQRELQRQCNLAQRIVDRHTAQECEVAWRQYLESVGQMNSIENRRSWPVPVARYLEPGVLERMIQG